MHDLLILKGRDVAELLEGRELEIIDAVERAYRTHALGDSSLPHSSFLRFPQDPANRIIALPTYLGGDFQVAGIKWIASFPDNIQKGLDRASAVIIQNDVSTGTPQAIIEGSIISARRTAASAALAAKTLHGHPEETRLGLVGGGLINFETVRFILAAFPMIETITLYDADPARAVQFERECRRTFSERFGSIEINLVDDPRRVFEKASLISIATTASEPHLADLSGCAPGATILHISLRDLSPEAILSADNIVDDVDHVCRAQTSVHLTEQKTGSRTFIRGTLADVLAGRAAEKPSGAVTVFSPFGLGVLDLALSKLVCTLAVESGYGQAVSSFLPVSRNTPRMPTERAL